jgi:transcriptional regulator GlxA family with amidase domain
MRTLIAAILVAAVAGGSSWGREPRHVAIVVYPGVELLDFAGPGEVFSAAGSGAFDVFTVAATREPIVSQGFVRVTPDHSIADSPKPDIVVIPGGHAASVYDDPAMMAWLKARIGAAELTMSVCNGALVLAHAGLLDGLRATSHYGAIPALRKFPRVTVEPDARFVDNGRIVTTQGVSAGIDGALHVVERLLGSDAAWSTARYMMYRWEPSLPETAKQELRAYVEQDWAKAAALYARRVEANPQDAQAAMRLGIAQKELHDDAHAAATLERAIALGAKGGNDAHDAPATLIVDALDELGDADVALGRFRDAARAYERELPLRYADAQPIVAMSAAKARERAGDKDAAIALLEKWLPKLGRHDGLREQPELANLRGDPRFEALVR